MSGEADCALSCVCEVRTYVGDYIHEYRALRGRYMKDVANGGSGCRSALCDQGRVRRDPLLILQVILAPSITTIDRRRAIQRHNEFRINCARVECRP